jgi:hypothetical protein
MTVTTAPGSLRLAKYYLTKENQQNNRPYNDRHTLDLKTKYA